MISRHGSRSSYRFNARTRVRVGRPIPAAYVTINPLICRSGDGRVIYYFCDNIPILKHDGISDKNGDAISVQNMWLVIHLDAPMLSVRSVRVAETGILDEA